MFRGTFAGRTIYDAGQAKREIARNGITAPLELEKTNSFLNPLGSEPARGWILMRRQDLNEIDLNGLHSLIFEYEPDSGPVQTMTANSLCIAKEPMTLSTGIFANDPNSLYIVEVADARWRMCNPFFQIPINASFNVLYPSAHNGTGFASAAADGKFSGYVNSTTYQHFCMDSLWSGGVYTWLKMVQYIWNVINVELRTAPSALPYTPDGTPDNWVFAGTPAWLALCRVLDHIGCAIKADLSLSVTTTGQYSIVRVGDDDAASDAIIAQAERDNRRIYDAEPLTVIRGKSPGSVTVYFPWQELWSTRSAAFKVINGPDYGSASVDTNSSAVIWDDLKAILNSTATGYDNDTALQTRAQERADNYYAMLNSTGGKALWQRYSGLLALSPGSTIKGVAWSCRSSEEGVFTEIVRHPTLQFGVTNFGKWQEMPKTIQLLEKAGTDQRTGIVAIYNSSTDGNTRSRFHVLTIDTSSVPISPTNNLYEFQRCPIFTGVVAANVNDQIAILLEPIIFNRIGQAVVDGVVPVQIDVTDSTHKYATATVGVYSYLTSSSKPNRGSARILWKESGTGTKWAIVRLGDTIPAQTGDIAALTDNTTGTADKTLEALTSGTVYATDVAAIRNNFADLAAQINLIRTNMQAAGLMS